MATEYDNMLDGLPSGSKLPPKKNKPRKRTRNRLIAVALGIIMGISSCFAVMVPYSRSSEAAIAVIDMKNIEQAIETAINTAKILTAAEKELLLAILHAKKLDLDYLAQWAVKQTKMSEEWAKVYQTIKGIMAKDYSVVGIWDERLGDLYAVLNGNMTVYDLVMKEWERQKTIEETAKAAAEIAKKAAEEAQKAKEELPEQIETLNNAEGEMQALQATGNIEASGVEAANRNTDLLSQLVVMEAVERKEEIMKAAATKAVEDNSRKKLQEYVDAMSDKPRY